MPIIEYVDPIPTEYVDSLMTITWQSLMTPDTTLVLPGPPIAYNGNVLYTQKFRGDYETVSMLNGSTGERLWDWNPPTDGWTSTVPTNIIHENIGVFCIKWNYLYALDLNSGSLLWDTNVLEKSQEDSGYPRVKVINDQVYHNRSNYIAEDTVSFLVRAPVATGVWDTVFRLDGTGTYRPMIDMPSLWVKPNGDSILFFISHEWSFDINDGRSVMYAYNLKTKLMEWEVNDFEPSRFGEVTLQPVTVHNDKIYLTSRSTVYCFDAATGIEIWKSHIQDYDNDNFGSSFPLIAGDNLVCGPVVEDACYAFNLETGALQWKTSLGGNPSYQVYVKGKIYYCDGDRLVCIDNSDGRVIWNQKSPNFYNYHRVKGTAGFRELCYSPELDCLFAHDGFYMMRIELAE